MKILLVSDEECLYLWDYYRPGRLDGIDLILSCGDLNVEYLSFLVTMGRAPVLYVHGNHDGGYDKHPPEGCTCIEDRNEAVRKAISMAANSRQRTLVLLLGRGSEKFQQIGGKSLACETDAQMIKEAISEYDKEKNRSRSEKVS